MDFKQFKEDMFKKLITHPSHITFTCKSYNIDTSTGDPNISMTDAEIRLRQTISLVCDILEEYEKQSN
jgi:hypothetical protein